LYRVQRLLSPQQYEHGPSKLAGLTVLLLSAVTGLFLTMTWASAQTAKPGTASKAAATQATQRPASAAAAQDSLRAELVRARATLEKSEDALQVYGRSNGLLFLSEGNSEIARLTALQNALTAAQIEGFQKDAVLQVTREESANPAARLSNPALVELRREEARLRVLPSAADESHHQVWAQIEVVERELKADARAAVQRAEAERRIVAVKEARIKDELEEQRALFNDMAAKLGRYQTLKREAEMSRQRYEALFERLQDAR
jgi:uncharacterized protein involved in exopolysaccharide biosynthesis